jgi:hypothetical protein
MPQVVVLILLILFSFTGCAKIKNSTSPLTHWFDVKPPDPDTVMVGVLPIQNATFHPIRMAGKKRALDDFMQNFLQKSLHFKYTEDDVAYVQKTLQMILTQRLYNSRFPVLSPDQIYSNFAETSILAPDKELDIGEITKSIPADWLLLVTLTGWEGDKFGKTGKGKFSYQAVVVDTRLKEAIWQSSREGILFEAPRSNLPYNRQGGETLNEVAKIILKGFPKPEKITEYQEKQLAVVVSS